MCKASSYAVEVSKSYSFSLTRRLNTGHLTFHQPLYKKYKVWCDQCRGRQHKLSLLQGKRLPIEYLVKNNYVKYKIFDENKIKTSIIIN